MKKVITKLIILGTLLGGRAYSQDISIIITALPPTIAIGDTGLIKVDISNNDTILMRTVPANKLRPQLSVPNGGASGIVVIPNQPVSAGLDGNNPDGWSVITNSGGSIRANNVNTIAPGVTSTYYVKVVGTMAGGPYQMVGTILWNGPQTDDNDVTNDNMVGSITVTVPLPVHLVSFTAKPENCNTVLNWNTAAESGFDHFDIEKSIDGRNFIFSGQVMAKGNNSNYNYTDVNTANGNTQYRLKITDHDGAFEYSTYASVRISCGNDMISIFPNPASDLVYVKGLKGTEAIRVYDATGRMLLQTKVSGNMQQLNLDAFADGLYNIVVIHADQHTDMFKIIKKDR